METAVSRFSDITVAPLTLASSRILGFERAANFPSDPSRRTE